MTKAWVAGFASLRPVKFLLYDVTIVLASPFFTSCLQRQTNRRSLLVCIPPSENTANQKARNPFHILRYVTGSIPRKNPGVPRGLQIFPAKRLIEEPATGQNLCTFKKRCQSVEYFFTDCICC